MQIKTGKVLIPQITPLISNSHFVSSLLISSPAFIVRHPPPIYPLTFSLPSHSPSLGLFSIAQHGMWHPVPVVRKEGGGTEGANATRGEAPASAGKQRGVSPL